MFGSLKTTRKKLLLALFLSGAVLPATSAFAQEDVLKAQGVMNSVNEILAQEGTPPAPAAAPAPAPVPVLETGDYEFEDTGKGETLKGGPTVVETTPGTEYDIGSDAFFDTEAILPKGKVGRAGPAPVDPKTSPASKLMIVEAVSPATNKSAQLVSAERAMALGRYDSALQIYEELYAKNPKDTVVLMGRAVTLQKIGRFDEAMQTYEALAELQPKNIDVKINMLGLLATRYPSIALRRLIDLHDSNKQNVGIVAQIAVTAANLGDFETAMRYLGIAMSMQPDNASHVFNAAVILDRAGQTKEAISYYEKALEIDSVYGGNRSIPRETIYERLATIR